MFRKIGCLLRGLHGWATEKDDRWMSRSRGRTPGIYPRGASQLRARQHGADPIKAATSDRYSLFLLLSLVVFVLLVPFLESIQIGGAVTVGLFSVTLIAAVLMLSQRRGLLWVAIPLVLCDILLRFVVHFYLPTRPLVIAIHVLSLAFFGFLSVALFVYLDLRGPVTSGRLYASVSLYLVLAMFWFSAYNLTETAAPGSFIQTVPAQTTDIQPDTLLYFSVATLTTLGFGDVIPVSAPARMFAALEAVSGVLYIAITVARLVAAYQLRSGGDAS